MSVSSKMVYTGIQAIAEGFYSSLSACVYFKFSINVTSSMVALSGSYKPIS